MFRSVQRAIYHLQTVGGDLWSGGRGRILVAVAVGWFLSLGVRLTFPVLLPYLRPTFGMDLTVAGLLLTVLWLSYALGQFPGGMLGDRVGEGAVLVASTMLTAATVGLLALSTSVALLFATTALFGASTALYGPTRYTIISDIYPDRDGTAIGITLAAGNVGNAVLPAVAGVLATALTWRLGFGLAVPLFVVAGIALWTTVPTHTSDGSSAVDTLSLDTVRHVFAGIAHRRVLLATGVLLLNSFVWQGFTGFYPTYLVDVKGLAPSMAAVTFGSFFALGIAVQPLAGAAGDRFGARATLFTVVGLVAVGLLLLPHVDHPAGLIVLTVLLSGLLGTSPVAHAYLVDALDDELQGSGLGLLRTVYMVLAASGPLVVGALADRGFFDEAFLLLAGVIAGALALVLSLPSGRRSSA